MDTCLNQETFDIDRKANIDSYESANTNNLQNAQSTQNAQNLQNSQSADNYGFNEIDNGVIGTKLFVGQIPFIATEELLYPIFAPYGQIIEIKIMKDVRNNNKSKGCAWVRYYDRQSALKAIDELHNKQAIPPQSNMLQVRLADAKSVRRFPPKSQFVNNNNNIHNLNNNNMNINNNNMNNMNNDYFQNRFRSQPFTQYPNKGNYYNMYPTVGNNASNFQNPAGGFDNKFATTTNANNNLIPSNPMIYSMAPHYSVCLPQYNSSYYNNNYKKNNNNNNNIPPYNSSDSNQQFNGYAQNQGNRV